MPSKKSAHYGALAERAARNRYGLSSEHDGWHDAETSDGQPVEIKSAMINRASGRVGRFRIFREYHQRLEREGGYYVFVAYRRFGRGISIARMRSVDADALNLNWYRGRHHRDSEEVKLTIEHLFGQ
jgi:hypothetical protein